MKSTRVVLLLLSIIAIGVCQFVILGQVQTSPSDASRFMVRCVSLKVARPQRTLSCGLRVTKVAVRLAKRLLIDWESSGLLAFRRRSIQCACARRVIATRNRTIDMTTTTSGLVMLQLLREASRSTSTSTVGSIDANVPAAAQKEFDKGTAALAEGGKDKIDVCGALF